MAKQDLNEQERLTAKNSVEEYIYEIRGKISDELEEFIVEDERNKFVLELEDAENWLYEEGEEADKPPPVIFPPLILLPIPTPYSIQILSKIKKNSQLQIQKKSIPTSICVRSLSYIYHYYHTQLHTYYCIQT